MVTGRCRNTGVQWIDRDARSRPWPPAGPPVSGRWRERQVRLRSGYPTLLALDDEHLWEFSTGSILRRLVRVHFDSEGFAVFPDVSASQSGSFDDVFEWPIECFTDFIGASILRIGVMWIDKHAILSPEFRGCRRSSVLEGRHHTFDLLSGELVA